MSTQDPVPVETAPQDLIPADTVRQTAMGIGEEVVAPRPAQLDRSALIAIA